MKCGITSESVLTLKENEIFVFGSNLDGFHTGGAANFAHRKFGAILGKGVGLQGKSYALPTKDKNLQTLELGEIRKYVDELLIFIKNNPEKRFVITKIGCGIAGLTVEQIAPMFKEFISVGNCTLPIEFTEE